MLPFVEAVLSKFERIAGPGDWYRIQDELHASSQAQCLTSEQQEEVAAELLAFRLVPADKGGSTYFSLPAYIYPPGKRATVPIVSLRAIEIWEANVSTVRSPIHKARYADLVWDLEPFVDGRTGRSHKMGRAAVEAYLDAITCKAFLHERFANDSIVRALDISASLGDRSKVEEIINLTISRGVNALSGETGLWLHPAEALLARKQLNARQKERIRADLEKRFQQSVTDTNRFAADQSLNTLLAFYPRQRSLADRQRILRKYGEMHRRSAETDSPSLAVSFLLPVIALFEEHEMPDEADKLRLYVEERGPQVEAEMYTYSTEQTLDMVAIEKMFEVVLKPDDMYLAMYRVARETMPKVQQTRARLARAQAEFPLQYLFTRVTFGNSGLPVSQTGSAIAEPDAHLSIDYGRELPISALFFSMGWSRAKAKFNLNIETLLVAMEGGPLFKEDRREFFLEGLRAHESGDYMKAIHILVPQVENMLRLLLRFLHRPVSKSVRNKPAVTELKNMNDVLRDKTVMDTLEEDLRYFLVHLYIEKHGFNLRNDLCHGDAPKNVFNEHVSGLVVQSIILLSAIRPEMTYLVRVDGSAPAETIECDKEED